VTAAAFQELSAPLRARCRAMPAADLKGIARPIDTLSLEWRDARLFPKLVRVEETGEVCVLPNQDLIGFGRLQEKDGKVANDIVLALPDATTTQKISRWHFELRRLADGFRLRQLSPQATEVDGRALAAGEEADVRPGAVVRLSGVITLTFLGERATGRPADVETFQP
jgi:hypothetical protein